MPFLAIALICWIAAGCYGVVYFKDLEVRMASLEGTVGGRAWERKDAVRRMDATDQRLDVVDTTATMAKEIARTAKQAAEGNAKTLQDHLDWVWAERAKREKAALAAAKPRKRAHDRDR